MVLGLKDKMVWCIVFCLFYVVIVVLCTSQLRRQTIHTYVIYLSTPCGPLNVPSITVLFYYYYKLYNSINSTLFNHLKLCSSFFLFINNLTYYEKLIFNINKFCELKKAWNYLFIIIIIGSLRIERDGE